MLGLDGAGKSMILYKLKSERIDATCLSIGKASSKARLLGEAALLRLNFLTGFNVETYNIKTSGFCVGRWQP